MGCNVFPHIEVLSLLTNPFCLVHCMRPFAVLQSEDRGTYFCQCYLFFMYSFNRMQS